MDNKNNAYAIAYAQIRETVKIGNKEKLNWNGYAGVPKYMDGDEVTVVGFTKQKVKVDNGQEILHVRYDQLQRVSKEMRQADIKIMNETKF